ncbi:MAG: hypothetical protein M3O32_07270 [Actinomycetota bacterium]|nr:hypothetical protein [Actinomycetota bacterium]
MTTAEVATPLHSPSVAPISWWDPASECTVTMATPEAAPDLFAEYHEGAVASYARFGVGDALDSDTARCAADTVLFWTIADVDGRVVGGVRAKGPLGSPQDSHAVVEWAGKAGEADVHDMIAERVPYGIVEMKAAWVDGGGLANRHRVKILARCGFTAIALLGLDFFMATSAAHVLDQWRSSGGVVAPIPATPYPDGRYETKMMWWDRRTFTVHGEPAQVASVVVEMARVHRSRRPLGDRGRYPRGPEYRPGVPRLHSTRPTHRTRTGQLRHGREDSKPGL